MVKKLLITALMFLCFNSYSQTSNYIDNKKVNVIRIDRELTNVSSNNFETYYLVILSIDKITNLPVSIITKSFEERELNYDILTLWRDEYYYKLYFYGYYEEKETVIFYLL